MCKIKEFSSIRVETTQARIDILRAVQKDRNTLLQGKEVD
jgi:hypothetical protein